MLKKSKGFFCTRNALHFYVFQIPRYLKQMRKRDRLEVIYDILKIIQDRHNSVKPTPLLRHSNLSSQSFTEYYKELKSKGLIKEIIDKKRKKFITLTDKGFKFLEKYKLILGFIDEFEL